MSKPLLQYYLVAFIDLLGQRNQMEGLLLMPGKSDISAREDLSARMTRLMTSVALVQNNIYEHTTSANSHHLEKIEGVDEGTQARVQQYRVEELHFQPFSDGIVLFSPLASTRHYALSSICSIMVACSSTMLLSLSKGFPLRAGIAIGSGCTLNGNDIYGPVVAEAYRLESKVAEYPRVVLHDKFLNWLASFEHKTHSSEQDRRVAVAMVKKCTDMVMFDEDGVPTLDFLNPTSLALLGGFDANKQLITSTRNLVSEMISKFSVENNQKLLNRYKQLDRYIDSRFPNQPSG
jgi:hypothetical protein